MALTKTSHPASATPSVIEKNWPILRSAYACCLWIAAAYVVVTTSYTVVRTMSPVVYWDAWQWVNLLNSWAEQGFTWSSLFSVQNEHQIAVERILLLADTYLSRGTNWPLVLLNVALYACALIAFVRLFRFAASANGADRIDLAAYSAFVSIVLFAAANLANLTWSFVVSYVVAMTFIVFAVLTVIQTLRAARHDDNIRAWAWLAATTAITLIGSYSSANGILVWPIVLVILAFGGLRKSQFAALASIGAVTIALYALTLSLNGSMNADPRITWRNPATYVDYLPFFLGNIVAAEENHLSRTIFALGYIGILGSIVAGLVFIRTRKSWNIYQIGLLGVLAFELVTGVMIALTRQNWGGGFAMIVDRYRLTDAMFWSAAVALPLSASWPRPWVREAARIATAALMAGITSAVVAHQGRTLEKYFDRYGNWEVAADALRMNVMDKPALQAVMVPDASMIAPIDFLRRHRLSVFADGRFEQVGKPFPANYQIAPNATCQGSVSRISAVDGERGAWRVTGEAWDTAERRVPGHLLFVDDASKTVVGLGSAVPTRPFFIRAQGPSRTKSWNGYLRAPAGSAVSVYGLRRDKPAVCLIAALRID